MAWQADLYTHLTGANTTAGNDVYALSLPDNHEAYPAVVTQVTEREPQLTRDGSLGYSRYQFELRLHAEDAAQLDVLSAEIEDEMQVFAAANASVMRLDLVGAEEMFDDFLADGARGQVYMALRYRIWAHDR